MRTPRLFLGVFALALLLPLLLLACGGSDEPADGPSSELATNEPESRASSGQTTAAPTTASAEPSPTPRATAVPTPAATAAPTTVQTSSETDRSRSPTPLEATDWNEKTTAATAAPTTVQTSSETDREALIVLYNATGGPDWNRKDNWLSDVPINEWEDVATDNNGRVIALYLYGNQLSGEIPPELGNLSNLAGRYPRSWISPASIAVPPQEPAERGDTPGVGQSRQPVIAGPPL